jgi:transposase
MSLQPQLFYLIPEETARVACAAFPRGHVYLEMYDRLGVIFRDREFAALFSSTGQPAEAPVRVALATILQFAEGLSDRQAANAVRSRLDWKYLLCLELTDPGFDHTVLSEFRSRLMKGGAEQQLFDILLQAFREQGLVKSRGKQRTDSTHVLAAVRALNRLECVGETMRHALNALAVAAPEWLLEHSRQEWLDRYGPRFEDYRLPTHHSERQAYAELMGADGAWLLATVDAPSAPAWLHELPALQTLRRVWLQNYLWDKSRLAWRDSDNIPPAALFISSPYDPEARYAKKRSTSWVGYKVHLTETCDDGAPRLITHVETTPGPTDDGAVTPRIHEALEDQGLLPETHLVDTGYVDAKLLVTSQQDYQVDLLGPTRLDCHWQARAKQGFEAASFKIDWERQQATCPQGKTSLSWSPAVESRSSEVIKIQFSSKDCGPCPSRRLCTRSKAKYPRRTITLPPEEQYQALKMARERQTTEAFKEQYALRSGIEATLSQGIRAFELRRSRYVGLARTHLQHVLTAAAMNFVRVGLWFTETPRAKTRLSAFQKLYQAAA